MPPEESIPTPKKRPPGPIPIPPDADSLPDVMLYPIRKARRASYDSVADRLAEGADISSISEQGYFDD